MKLLDLLNQNKAEFLETWIFSTLKDYPDESICYLNRKKDRFSNPLRYNLKEGLTSVFEALVDDEGPKDKLSSLHELIKIKAVQDFSPSQALMFIFRLKDLVREHFAADIKENNLFEELSIFEKNLDKIILEAFDFYQDCREKIFSIRTEEIKRSTYMLTRIAGKQS